MATEKSYTVLVCDPKRRLYGQDPEVNDDELDPELFWEDYGAHEAASPAKAVEALWETNPELKVNTELRYFVLPLATIRPKRQRRSFIERWTLDAAELPDEEPPGQTELVT